MSKYLNLQCLEIELNTNLWADGEENDTGLKKKYIAFNSSFTKTGTLQQEQKKKKRSFKIKARAICSHDIISWTFALFLETIATTAFETVANR